MEILTLKGRSKIDRPFFQKIGFAFAFLLFSTVCLGQKTRVFIDWKVGECVACQGPVNDYLKNAPAQDTLFVMFPENYRSEEALIREALPVLAQPQVKVVWNDSFRKSLGTEMVSYLYHIDAQGKVVVKAPLKGLPVQAFMPFDPALKIKDILPTQNPKISGNWPSAFISGRPATGDTLYFVGSFPLKPTDFGLSERYIAVADQLSNGMFYYDRKMPKDTIRWNVLRAQMLRPATYRAYFRLSETADTKELEDSLDAKTAVTGFGTAGSITGMHVQDNSIYFSVKYLYLSGFALNNIIAFYKLEDGSYHGPLFEKSSFKNAGDSLWKSSFEQVMLPPFASAADSNRLEKELTENYNRDYQKLVARTQLKFTMTGNPGIYLGKNRFAVQVAPSDSQNYWLLAYYRQDDTSLQPLSLAPYEKPELWRKHNLGLNMTSLTGHYPYLMMPIANTIYDLRTQKTYTLPISMGDYDYSPEAMRVFKPKLGMFVQDVIGSDSQVRVLYSVKEKADQAHRLYLLYYDLISGKILSQNEFLPGGAPFSEDVMYRFDGIDKVAALRQDCRCIVFYPIL